MLDPCEHPPSDFRISSCRTRELSFYQPWLPVIDNPDLNDPLQNHKRLRLLYLKRAKFIIEIPPDTTWWNVRSLTEDELGELGVSAQHTEQWNVDNYKLESVAAVVRKGLTSPPTTSARTHHPVGSRETGPFSILEGNHRMLACANTARRPPLNIDVYVESLTSCVTGTSMTHLICSSERSYHIKRFATSARGKLANSRSGA